MACPSENLCGLGTPLDSRNAAALRSQLCHCRRSGKETFWPSVSSRLKYATLGSQDPLDFFCIPSPTLEVFTSWYPKIGGCSFLVLYEAGVVNALQELSPEILKSASTIYGASSGSVVATLALCGTDIDLIKQTFLNSLTNAFWMRLPGGKILKVLRDFLNKYLPPNAHQLVSGKLNIIVTRVHDWRSVVVSEFASKEDLIQAIICSCFIPVYFGFSLPKYHGVRYVDGELGMWRANFVTRTTITVSAFAGEYDICPKDCPAAFFNFQLSDCILQISKRNICRMQHIFQIPTHQVLDQTFIHGYQDTVSFFKRLSEFGINYLDEDFMFSLANESRQKGEGTLHWKPETRVLSYRATDPEDVTQENPGTTRAADEAEEEAPHHLLHHQKATNLEGSKHATTSTGRRSRSPRVCEAQE